MPHDHFHIIGVRTAEVEWFVLAPRDEPIDDVMAEPLVGQLERNLRTRLAGMGFPEAEVEEMFRHARKWMATTMSRPSVTH